MRIILFLLLVVVFLAIFSSRSITSKQKMILATLLVLIFGGGYIYETNLDKQELNSLKKIEAFKQGKTLICNNIKVNKEHFDYLSGTETFSPKPNDKYVDMVISVDKCVVQK